MKTKEQLEDEREIEASQVNLAYTEANHKKERFLVKWGWKYGCDYPDSCWRWSKVINGQRVNLNANAAFDMERDFLEPCLAKEGKPK